MCPLTVAVVTSHRHLRFSGESPVAACGALLPSTHLSLYFRERLAKFPKLRVAVRVVAEETVEQLKAVGTGRFHQA